MMDSLFTTGALRIRNDSGSPYTVVELPGVIIADGATIDLLDVGLVSYYDDWSWANRCVTECATSALCQDIESGAITVVENTKPTMKKVLP